MVQVLKNDSQQFKNAASNIDAIKAGKLWAAMMPRGLVAILHGIGEHSGRYAALASDLALAGYTVVAVDLPGHGEAPGPRGDIRSWETVRDNAVTPASGRGFGSGRPQRSMSGPPANGATLMKSVCPVKNSRSV